MTPGAINLKVVADRLGTVAECVAALRRLPAGDSEEFHGDWRNAAAADSALRRAIEARFDTAPPATCWRERSAWARSNWEAAASTGSIC